VYIQNNNSVSPAVDLRPIGQQCQTPQGRMVDIVPEQGGMKVRLTKRTDYRVGKKCRILW